MLRNQQSQLPVHGLKRASEILKFLPFGRTTLWKWSSDGRFPAPIRLSESMTCWRCEDIHAWLTEQYNKNQLTTTLGSA